MRYRAFGGNGFDVSEIGFGCGPTAGLLMNGSPEERRGIIEYALRTGINYFDTAAAYGEGSSEANLGRTLAELSAKPIIATKVTLMERRREYFARDRGIGGREPRPAAGGTARRPELA
jgi:L-galactose dehydrogenase/L-glyceraldehyde 3-phosphate reductase